jgi:O-antigen/teichoic acid export membrane protein
MPGEDATAPVDDATSTTDADAAPSVDDATPATDDAEGGTDDDLSALASSASLVLVGSLFGSGSKLLEQVVIGRLLSTSAYGEVNIALSTMTLGSTLALLGLDQGISRFASRYDDERDVRGLWVVGLALAGATGMLLSAALLLAGDRLRRLLFEPTTPPGLLTLFALALPFLVGLRLGVGAVRGHENTRYRTYAYDLLYNGLRLALLVALLLAGGGVLAAGYAYLAAAVVAFVVVHTLLNRLLALRGPFRTHVRDLLTFSAPLVVAAAVSALFAQIDTIMLGALLPSTAPAGAYNKGYTIAAGLPVVLSVFGFLYMPLAARLDAGDDRDEVRRVYAVTTKWIFVAAFPLFLTFVAFPADLVTTVFGTADPRSGMALAVLAVGFFVSAANGRCQDTLSAFGHTRAILAVNTVAALVNVAANLLLIPRFGVIGAAAASALSFVTLNVSALLALRWLSGIEPFSGPTTRAFLALPVALLPPAFALSGVVSLSILTLPVFVVGAGVAVVAVTAAAGALQSEDAVLIDLVEGRLGVHVPLVRRYVPEDGDGSTMHE